MNCRVCNEPDDERPGSWLKYPMRLKYGFILALILMTLISSKSDAFEVGYFDLAPHSKFVQNGSQEGLALKYFKEVAAEMGLKNATLKEYPLPRLLALLEANQIDMALFLAKNSQREKQFVYPQQPFFQMQSVLVVSAKSKLNEVKSVLDLMPLKIGVWQEGYHSPIILDKRLKLETLTGGNIIERNIRKVVSGRIDAYYSPDGFAVAYEAKKFELSDKIKILPLPEKKIGLYSVFSQKSAGKFKNNYERALNNIESKHSYEKFLSESMK